MSRWRSIKKVSVTSLGSLDGSACLADTASTRLGTMTHRLVAVSGIADVSPCKLTSCVIGSA